MYVLELIYCSFNEVDTALAIRATILVLIGIVILLGNFALMNNFLEIGLSCVLLF